MEPEIYERIKKEQKDYETIAKGDYSEIEDLEKQELIKRYLYLKKLKKEIDKTRFYDGENPDIPALIIDNYGYGQIKKTNEIWVSIMDLANYDNIMPNMPKDTILYIYWDLENKSKEIIILVSEKEDFESSHNVVTGNMEILDPIGRYYNTRYQFFKMLLEEGQEVAVSYILNKYGVNKGKSR